MFGSATPKSDDATLSALAATGSGSADGTFAAVTLTPAFSAGTTAYAATVTGAVTHVKLTPRVTDSDASVTVAGNAVTSGSSSDAVSHSNLGANEIAVVVTAEDGSDEDLHGDGDAPVRRRDAERAGGDGQRERRRDVHGR